ncbi:formimidoylglutamase [Croceitalea rosinachiae]|uniref:Formimidoylglutamase n=1 Tax=Croceitalea rosinachiae TaxID=3075596 RepID=A0ABU3A785_9FLAO|nr:formimidoylglutamase [Croceitalea sp. F388]MDT0605819.1 formimidoylglutamase [Croceitalea sp. F388]
MQDYIPPKKEHWHGRTSDAELYLHEKVELKTISKIEKSKSTFVLLGYACDEGVKRNQGRIGAKGGPLVIRQALAKMPNHLEKNVSLIDAGDIICPNGDLEKIQGALAHLVYELLQKNTIPILLGGGHDIAYGHFNGIKKHLMEANKRPSIGIINFDAHFDLRTDDQGPTSGTPFFQIANENEPFHYLCLGIRSDANDKKLFQTAQESDVTYVEKNTFRIQFTKEINTWIRAFMEKVNHVYVTIDLDGFSSAYAPGVSAPSPLGFSPDIVLESLEIIIASGKLISLDIAEMNPKFDIDNQTAKLAASLVHTVIHSEFP